MRDHLATEEGLAAGPRLVPPDVRDRAGISSSCYTDPATQDKLQQVFEYTAGLFDEIMIDDFWFTDCKCQDCEAGRQSKRVASGDKPITTK